MKKLLFIIIFFFNFLPSYQHGRIALTQTESAYCQPCPPDSGGSGGSGNGGGGGGFWYTLGNFFSSIGSAIGSFFSAIGGFFDSISGAPGESYGGEGNSYSWDPPYTPDPYYGASGGPFDPSMDPFFTGYIDYYNNYYGNGQNTPQPPKYYIMRGGDTTKYYDGDTIYAAVQAAPLQLNIYNANGAVNTPPLTWKCNDTIKCSAVAACGINVSTIRSVLIKVDSAGVKTLIKNPIKLYPKPIIYFRIGNNYKGEYGFDDSSYQHPIIKNNQAFAKGTEVKPISTDPAYVVPWMSLLENQTASIKVEVQNLSPIAANDPTFSVVLAANNPNTHLTNGLFAMILNYNQVKTLNSLTVHGIEFDALSESNKTVDRIYAQLQTSDTIGKLNYSCQKPLKKKIVFIYVNTGSGIRNITKQACLDSLNKFSQNQYFRQWVLDTLHSSNGMDTINLTNEYNAMPAIFKSSDSIYKAKYIDSFFYKHKGIMMRDMIINNNGTPSGPSGLINDTGKIHFMFLFNYSLKPLDNTLAISMASGYKSLIFKDCIYKDVAHEIGHLLSLKHTFDSPNANYAGGYNIPSGTTKNYMDYALPGQVDKTEMFYFADWVKIY